MNNRILLDNYFLPGDLEAHIAAFVGHYNHQRYHESLSNLTPADVYTGRGHTYTGRGHTILLEREKTKRKTMKLRRLHHARAAAYLKPDEPNLLNIRQPQVSNYLTTDTRSQFSLNWMGKRTTWSAP